MGMDRVNTHLHTKRIHTPPYLRILDTYTLRIHNIHIHLPIPIHRDAFQMEVAAIESANRREQEEFDEQMTALAHILDTDLQLPPLGKCIMQIHATQSQCTIHHTPYIIHHTPYIL
ncbi:hypothetical protein EON63_12895 [archaeon]|nr:MAG: hypothetical protein EON63_12895 [archaeon]